MLVAAGVGAWGLQAYPVDRDNVFLQLIELRSPTVFRVLVYGYATLWFTTPFFAASLADVARDHRRVPLSAERSRPRRCRRTRRRRRAGAVAGAGRDAFRDDDGACADADVAHDSAARPLHRRDDPRRRRHRQDVGLHVSRTSISSCAGARDDPDRKVGGLVLEVKGDFCRQVRAILRARRPRGRLPRDRARHRRLLQPAAQRSRSVRRRVCDRHAAEQPVRQVEGAVLAAGVHRSAEVRDLCCGGSPTATRRSRRCTATSSTTRRSTGTSAR